ncbi:protein Mp1R-MYB11 [Marchantia polymorpha subsp. ruderalis]|uniref:Uncharacterized protein n=2 Tax=Marchantia polymorpha TaxID=3197 RepID=A0A176W8F1_MARPO|nr:hypothetical protein AXG93_3102s1150 [Marchantia polymorpha subsp. ruderalis]PTQ40019.1 hypothetical protein MARPO_0042s0058 [Marchantia polymorpha]BBN02320.1 hypothetical protein Mp_2g14310 [Marchantia polymorpha subsp. ruderalis]|eukprot:PTQ40019.1 hypothetical protein MARPO_0042s0058 [Marchantia polymorpha]
MLGVMAAGSPALSGMGPQGSEEGSKKVRKPYTITKSRESWTEQEHDKFLEALQLFDRDWKKIEAFVGSKSVIQIRSHAQKYFLKVQKNGTGEHVPPPRPKRKSAQPYPQKAPKAVSAVQQPGVLARTLNPQPTQSEPCLPRRGNFQSCSIGSNSGSWQYHSMPPVVPITTDLRATPDFAEVYKFIGNVFDPGMNSNHNLKKLKEMAPIDRETVLLLMRNLSINLSSPEFEERKLFMPAFEANPDAARPDSSDQHLAMLSATQPPSDGGDDDAAFSGQPSSNHQSDSGDSDSQVDPSHGQTRVLPSYSDGPMDVAEHRRLTHEGGSRSVDSVLPIAPYPGLTSSRPMTDNSSAGAHRSMGLHSHPHMAFSGRADVGFGMPLPTLTPGVVGEGNIDNWWS